MKHYTVAQMEAFLAISEAGSFRLAAERLAITQPSISQRIKELESGLGCALFVREKSGVRLSESGQIALQYVQRGFDIFQEMERRLSSGDPLTGSLRLGASNTIALSCLPALLAVLEQRHPTLQVELTINNSAALRQLLDAQKLDIAFLVDAPIGPRYAVEELASFEIAWFAQQRNGARTRPLQAGDLQKQRIVTMPPPSPFHNIIGEWFAASKIPLPDLNTCNDMATLVRLVRMGVAVSVLPACLVAGELAAGTIVRLKASPAFPPLIVYGAYRRRDRAKIPDRASQTVMDIARKVIGEAGLGVKAIAARDGASSRQ